MNSCITKVSTVAVLDLTVLVQYHSNYEKAPVPEGTYELVLYETAELASPKFNLLLPCKPNSPDSEFSRDHRTCLKSPWSSMVHAPELREVCG